MVASDGGTLLRTPNACTDQERAAFAQMVTRGFGPAPGERQDRIRRAECLAFRYGPADGLVGIAALKAPGDAYRAEVFAQADADAGVSASALELGWVFVDPAHRGRGIAYELCRCLVDAAPAVPIFATTRPDNAGMIRILRALGFARLGTPFPRKGETLALFLLAGGRGP